MPALSPALTAGLLLAALSFTQQLELSGFTASSVLAATGATRTTAYKAKAAVLEALPGLLRPAGRPPKEAPEIDGIRRLELAHKVRDFLLAYPGCAASGRRNHYSERYHLFVLELAEDHVSPSRGCS